MSAHPSGHSASKSSRTQRPKSRHRNSRKQSSQPGSRTSFKVGRVTAYLRGKVWYVRYFENGKRIQRRVGPKQGEAEQLAAEINAQIQCGMPSVFGFEQCLLHDLRSRWLAHHEDIKRSSLATISRYRSATAHLIRFAEESSLKHPSDFTSRSVESFVRFLRTGSSMGTGWVVLHGWVLHGGAFLHGDRPAAFLHGGGFPPWGQAGWSMGGSSMGDRVFPWGQATIWLSMGRAFDG